MICLGHILDEKRQKASKSRGNVLDPNYVFETFGSDAIRWLFFTSTVGESYAVGPRPLEEVVRQFLLTLWNVYSFLVTYARIDGFKPGERPELAFERRPVLDRWLLSRLNRLVASVDEALFEYEVNDAARPLQSFVEDLSTWYVRRSRRRFWKSESDADKLSAYQTLHRALVTLAELLAPLTPFVAEAIYRNLTGERSVHLADFPQARAELDDALEHEMSRARRAVEAGLAARDAARIKVRQPLNDLALPGEPFEDEIAAIVRDELNVKSLSYGAPDVRLDTEITEDLRLEGLARELVRNIQSLRKQSGFNIEDRIVTYYETDGLLGRALEKNGDYVRAETLSVELRAERPDGVDGVDLKVEGEPIWLALQRVR